MSDEFAERNRRRDQVERWAGYLLVISFIVFTATMVFPPEAQGISNVIRYVSGTIFLCAAAWRLTRPLEWRVPHVR